MQTNSLTSLEQALEILQQRVQPVAASERVAIVEATGRVLARRIESSIDVPAFDNSAMDGFAVNTEGLERGEKFPLVQVITAGHPGTKLEAGTVARIFTGAPVPEGADAVVMQENAEYDDSLVSFLAIPQPGENIRKRGHDIQAGSEVLQAGRCLLPQDIGLLASLGLAEVEVCRSLRVAIINTGDELVTPGQSLAAGQIYESNSYTLEALLNKLQVQVVHRSIVADDLDASCKALQQATREADCIISSGGVSVGDADFIKPALEQLGELSLWKLAIKPGKPFSFGHIGDIPFFGLPGNPVAVFVSFVLLVKPFLQSMQGMRTVRPQSLQIAAGFDRPMPGSRQEYLRVRVQKNSKGASQLVAFENQGSSVMSSLSWADGLAVIPPDTVVKKGDLLEYLPFTGLL